ncbi:UNVERIFIED_CONTAM: Transposon Tf2-11 polyprotein [Sesamum calycinum]|uniref:Transposon Tf2-11 polyprotein n=1 Tax=Sesamum calycinum TaxID=2727403 RepID=A0AAW2MN82_9LAMI
MIQCFNQGGQRVVGIIRMQLTMEDMVSSALLHVIDAKTSYNMFLGRPWLRENAVVPSKWHQCFKYCRDGIVKKVLDDDKPFTEAESHFVDANYYIEDAKKGKEINMKQPSKPSLKGFVPSTQEEEGGHLALATDEKGFDPKAFKLLIKVGYNPNEKLNLGRLPLEATGKKLHGLNATQIMLKEKKTCNSRFPSRVLKAKAQTVIFTQVQSDDEDDKESVASFNYISNSIEENIAQTYHITLIEDSEVEEEYVEDAPAKLEEGEVNKLIEVSFIQEVKYPMWISSIVPVRKKNGQIRVCVDFRDLNNAWSKDDFPLPIAELMIDATIGHEALSFMDGSSRYNQIRMAPGDEELTAFRTPKGILLAQKNDEGKENALYYLSRTMTPNELKYSPIEKLCLALIFSIQKLKHYFQSHTIHLVSKANPLKYVMAKPVLSDRLAIWYLQLQQFEITYIHQKAVKGQVLADFLADHPMPAEWELSDDLPDEDVLVIEVAPPWKMYFDRASHKEGVGAGVVFVTSEGEVIPYSFTLTQNCSNNVAEYQDLILGLEIVVDAKQLPLKVYRDSQLMANQLLGDVELEHLPRKDNKQADALAKLASTLSMTDKEARIQICKSWVIPPIFSDNEDDMFQEEENHITEVFEVEEEDWRQPLVDYLKYGKLPNDLKRRTDTRRRATRFIY